MEMITIRELYKDRESYLDREITMGDGCAVCVTLKVLAFWYSMMGHFLIHCKLFTTIQWTILRRFPG